MGFRDSAWLGLGLALVAACGRSALAVPGGARGEGGQGGAGGSGEVSTSTGPATSTSSTSTSTSSGAGGQGGSGACTAFDFVGPVLGIAGGAGYRQIQSRFVQTTPDTVTVVAEWRDAGGSGGPPPSELRHTTFAPWGLWPSGDIGPSYLADLDGGRSFAPTVPAGSADGTFDLFFRGLAGVTFMPSVIADSGLIPPAITADPADARVLYASSLADLSLFALERAAGPNDLREIVLGSAVRAGPGPVAETVRWCSNDFSGGAAVPRPGGDFIVAQSYGSDAPCAGSAPDPTLLDLGTLSLGASVAPVFQPIVTLSAEAPLRRMRAVGDGGGMWLAAQMELAEPMLWLLHFEPATGLVLGPIEVLGAGEVGRGPLAVTMFGERVLVAWIDDPQALEPTLQLALYEPDGTLHARASAPTEGNTSGPLSLLGGPSGTSALVGWSLDLGDQEDRIRLLRIDCAD
jgi:hypothetical protein